ncbi:MAG: hypothetical protein OSJ73_24505 [Lachnospiraceae bacterium]|nr:hypothetical protein [Lachnospiraceae bacterium]
MERSEQSNSFEQQMAEQIIFEKVQNWLNKNLKENAKILVGKTYMQPDFYSKEDGIIGEIFAHIGKPKKGQDNKIANDILKMLLLEKLEKRTYRKIIVVCDEQEMKKITGTSVLAECIRQFDIEVKMINIETDLRTMLIAAQKRQRMTNA